MNTKVCALQNSRTRPWRQTTSEMELSLQPDSLDSDSDLTIETSWKSY